MKYIKTLFTAVTLIMFNIHSCEIHAHRGARDTFPENTIPAFSHAWENGADLIELDVQVTKDGIVVVHHNFELNPEICCREGGEAILDTPLLHSISLEELKKLDFGTKTSQEFPDQKKVKGTKIPTLEELILEIKTSKHPQAASIRLNIELKRDLRFPHLSLSAKEIVNKVLDIIHKHDFTHRIQYSSFDPEILMLLRTKEPNAILSCLFSEEILNFISTNLNKSGLDFIISFAKTHRINILSPDHNLIKEQKQVDEIKKAGFKIVVWTVNDDERCLQLCNMGVDGIITDTPKKLVEFFRNKFNKKGTTAKK